MIAYFISYFIMPSHGLCYYFEAFSTFPHWVVDREIGNAGSLHFLDDFLFIGRTASGECLAALNKFIQISDYFSILLAGEKTVYPTTCIEFLNITINSTNMEFYLTERGRVLLLNSQVNNAKGIAIITGSASLISFYTYHIRCPKISQLFISLRTCPALPSSRRSIILPPLIIIS